MRIALSQQSAQPTLSNAPMSYKSDIWRLEHLYLGYSE